MTCRALLLALPLAALAACTEQRPPPGDQLIGSFTFRARRVQSTCPGDAGFTDVDPFEGTFSACTPGSTATPCIGQPPARAFFTQGASDRPGTFDGQTVSIDPVGAPRVFPICAQVETGAGQADCVVTVTETFSAALFSDSQSAAIGSPFRCDAGIPAPDPDGGVRLPVATPGGYDVVHACGVLVDVFAAGENCSCALPGGELDGGSCTAVFQVVGDRK